MPKLPRHVRESRKNGAKAKNKGQTLRAAALDGPHGSRPPCKKGWLHTGDVWERARKEEAKTKKIKWASTVEFIDNDLPAGVTPQHRGMPWHHFQLLSGFECRVRHLI